MPLTDFFRINMPYGIAKDSEGKWMAFNREYMPLGFNNTKEKAMPGKDYHGYPIYTKYDRITNAFLESLADDQDSIIKDENGDTETVFLYRDSTSPFNGTNKNKEKWARYMVKIEKLSKLRIKFQ